MPFGGCAGLLMNAMGLTHGTNLEIWYLYLYSYITYY
jgi:hypothetical protein